MLSTGKQKFVGGRAVNYLNTLKTKAESHLKDLGIISFIPELRKRSPYCVTFRLNFRVYAIYAFLAQNRVGSNN